MVLDSETLTAIESALTNLDIIISRTLNDSAEYDFVIDYFEPTRAYAYSTDDVLDVELGTVPESGILLLYEDASESVYACGVGQYNSIGSAAFEPVQEHFKPS